MRFAAIMLAALTVSASLVGCGVRTGPAGTPSSTNVNPETGSRGGSGASGR